MTLRTVGIKLQADVAGYMTNMGRAAATTRDFTGELNRAAKGGHVEQITRATAGLGLGLAGIAGTAVKMSMDFDKSMSAVSAATHAGQGDIDRLRGAALQAGKDTQYSATQAADGITELAKAGVTTADILGGGLKGALNLAAAGQLDVGEAAETAATAMTQFNLKGSQVGHVADLLAAGAGKAQGSVHDMGYALKQGGLVASQMGLSIEDTTGALAAFASAGLIGADSGTSFKSMLQSLQNPSAKSRDLMKDLGIQVYDAQGKFVGLTALAGQLQVKLQGLTQAQRDQAMAQIFGSDGIRAATVLYKQGATGIQGWIDKVNDSGYASETAAKLTDNLAGDLERLKGSIETLAIQSGSGANSGLRILARSADSLVHSFSDLPPVLGSTITIMAAVSGGALLLGAGWLKLRETTTRLRVEVEAMGPAGEKAAAGMSRLGSAAGKVGVVFVALEAAGAVIGHFQDDLNPQLDALTIGLQRYAAGGQLAGESSRILGADMEKLDGQFQILADTAGRATWARNIEQGLESIVPGLKGTDKSLASTKERVVAMDAALAQLASSGNTQEASAIFQKLAAQLATGGVSMAEFRKQFPQYAAAVETAGAATAGAASQTKGLSTALDAGKDAQHSYKTAAEASAGAIRGERDALGQLSTFMKAEADPVFGLIDAQKKLTDAQRVATKAIKDHGKNSIEAKDATRSLALAAIDLQGKAGSLSQTFDGKMTPALRATLKAAGLTDAEIKILEGQFKSAKKAADAYDDKYEAKASAPGAKQAKTDLDKAYTSANNFAGPYQARLSISGDKAVNAKLAELLIKQRALATGLSYSSAKSAVQKDLDRNRQAVYAEGGWTGPGDKYDPAGVVHADEFVIRKESRRKIEAKSPGLLAEMNATGQAPGYAAGGHVMNFPATASRTRIPSWEEVASHVVAAVGSFGHWPSSPGAQRGDSGVWHKILALVKASGIPYDFGNSYRPGDPLWHGSGRAIDFMGYNQDRLAQFFLARQGQVLELIHRSNKRDYGVTRGHYNAMPHQWPLHRNHLHIAMQGGGTITEPIFGMGASGRSYSFGENGLPERVTPGGGSDGASQVVVSPVFTGPVGSRAELENWLSASIDSLRRKGKV